MPEFDDVVRGARAAARVLGLELGEPAPPRTIEQTTRLVEDAIGLLCKRATEIFTKRRGEHHNDPLAGTEALADIWSGMLKEAGVAVRDTHLRPKDAALMMVAFKLHRAARARRADFDDYQDAVVYLAFALVLAIDDGLEVPPCVE